MSTKINDIIMEANFTPTLKQQQKLIVLKKKLSVFDKEIMKFSLDDWMTKEYKILEEKMNLIGKDMRELTGWGYPEFQNQKDE